ncbi:hypothetical protein AMTR_s00178p00030030 [Amborella trichopoda]|uniref:Uncharacterized protein n=1 Tax=Amborella trichopoda TaxID=13333 RepID=W1PJX0_AMBTC|nr:hypothetical protein AMTR_s00178p00030030 [Amborella trichopoda]
MSSLAPRVELETSVAKSEVLGLANFDSSCEPARASVMVKAMTPPVVSSSAPRVEPKIVMAQPEVSSLTSFCLVRESVRVLSSVVKATMPLTASNIGSPAHPSLSPGDFLCTFA